jgi:hypothetical protein
MSTKKERGYPYSTPFPSDIFSKRPRESVFHITGTMYLQCTATFIGINFSGLS